jgi:DivIVA domain-containing protein
MIRSSFPVRLRGYERARVDEVVARIEANLGRSPLAGPLLSPPLLTGPPLTSREVREMRFAAVFRGYDRRAVDERLLEYIRELALSERGSRSPGSVRRIDGLPDAGWLVDWIRQSQFGVSRLRRGYLERDVDDFLDRVVAGMVGAAPPVSARDVRDCGFRAVRFRAGYHEPDVDRFLAQLASALETLDMP